MKQFLFILILSFAPSCWATWTTVQAPTAAACSAATACLSTVSSTGSSHLLTVTALSINSADAVSSCCSAGCASSWTQGPNITGGGPGGHSGAAELWYCLNSASGATSIGPTWLDTNIHQTAVREFSSSTGSIALDTGSTPTCTGQGTSQNPVQCSLTPSTHNDVYIIGNSFANVLSACSQSFTCTFPAGNGEGYKINQVSYAATTWTGNNNVDFVDVSAAFQEAFPRTQVGGFLVGP